MGLKLHNVSDVSATGDLDGHPFQLEATPTGWRASLGREGALWSRDIPYVDVKDRTVKAVRAISHHAVALYRQFERFGATPA